MTRYISLLWTTYSYVSQQNHIVEANFRKFALVIVEVLDFETTLPAWSIKLGVFDGECDTR